MKAVVLAGGKGSRLAPYTKILPKPLMPIGDMPILEIILRQMKCSGIEEVVLTVGHLGNLLSSFFQDGSQFGLKVHYSHEEQPLGTAGPLSLVDGLEDTFMVTNGDVLTTLDFKELVDFHKRHQGIATIACHQRQVRIDYGVLESNTANEIIQYNEKPTYELSVSMGIYVFEPEVLSYIPHNQYLDFPNLVLKMIAAGERVISYPYHGYWMDLGRISDYEQAVQDFETTKPQFLREEAESSPTLAKTPAAEKINHF